MKGPSWLEVAAPEPAQAKVSWCRLEAGARAAGLRVLRAGADLDPPPLVVATVTILYPTLRATTSKLY